MLLPITRSLVCNRQSPVWCHAALLTRLPPCRRGGRRFDALLGEHSVYKVETIGDCYMVAGGLVFTDAQGYTSVMPSKVRQGQGGWN
jgi:hypothetical protein